MSPEINESSDKMKDHSDTSPVAGVSEKRPVYLQVTAPVVLSVGTTYGKRECLVSTRLSIAYTSLDDPQRQMCNAR